MLFQRGKLAIAALALTMSFGLVSCMDDEEEMITEEPVIPTPAEIATPPVVAQPTAEEQMANAAAEAAAMNSQIQQFAAERVYFAFDDYNLSPSSQEQLSRLADFLKDNSSVVVQIEGHCDERGSIEYNLALGERRAQSVKNFLSQLGVQTPRLSTISYGEENPAVEGHNESAWSRNRRAEFTISQQ